VSLGDAGLAKALPVPFVQGRLLSDWLSRVFFSQLGETRKLRYLSQDDRRALLVEIANNTKTNVRSILEKRLKPVYTRNAHIAMKKMPKSWQKRHRRLDRGDMEHFRSLLRNSRLLRSLEDLDSEIDRAAYSLANNPAVYPDHKALAEAFEKSMSPINARIRTIARSEAMRVANAARERQFKKFEDEMNEALRRKGIPGERKILYRWVGPQDSKTSRCCSRIKREQGAGLPLDELKELVMKVSLEEGFEGDWRMPHPNCRHTFTPVKKRV